MELEFVIVNTQHVGVKFSQAQVTEILARAAKEAGVPIPDKCIATLDVYDDRENFVMMTVTPR